MAELDFRPDLDELPRLRVGGGVVARSRALGPHARAGRRRRSGPLRRPAPVAGWPQAAPRSALESAPRADREGPRAGSCEAPGQLGGGHTLGQFQQRPEGFLGFRPRCGPGRRASTRPRDGRDQKGPGIVVGQAGQPQLCQPRQVLVLGGLADSEQHQHRLGKEPATDKPEDLAGRGIEPLRVVDDAQTAGASAPPRPTSRASPGPPGSGQERRPTSARTPLGGRSAEGREEPRPGRASVRRAGAAPRTAIPSRTASRRCGPPGSPRPCPAHWSRRAVLPIPASPRTTRAALSPDRTLSSSRAKWSRSAVLPRKAGERLPTDAC